jgi:hypothetical protein
MQNRVALYAIVLTLSCSLAAQRDRGSGGTDRSGNERRQDQALNRNFDPRFLPYKDVIGHELKQQVGQVVQRYESIRPNSAQIAPDEFLVIQVAAKKSKVPVAPLIDAIELRRKSLFAAELSQQQKLGVKEMRNQFSQDLASALTRQGLTSENAKTEVDAAVRIVSQAKHLK